MNKIDEKFPLIIAGGRDFNDIRLALKSLKKYCIERNLKPSDIEIVSGTAKGADFIGEFIAKGLKIEVKDFKPDWDKHGQFAGFMRNEQMAIYTSKRRGGCLVFWDGQSKGTMNMIKLAKEYELDYEVINYDCTTK